MNNKNILYNLHNPSDCPFLGVEGVCINFKDTGYYKCKFHGMYKCLLDNPILGNNLTKKQKSFLEANFTGSSRGKLTLKKV